MSVDLRVMRYIVAVAEEGGFQDAAHRLHVAQPALSRQVRQVERELGVELFSRRPTGVTEPGRAFVEEARRILAEVDRAVERTRRVAQGEIGTVRIGHAITAAFDVLPRLLARIERDHPAIEVETGRRWDAELTAHLDDGQFDLVVGHQLPRRAGGSAVLGSEPLAAVVAADHPLAARPAIALRDLRGETVRLPPRRLAPSHFDLVTKALHGTGEDFAVGQSADPRLGTFGVDDLGGFTVVPSSVGTRLPRSVSCVPLTDPLPDVEVVAVWRPQITSPAVALVVRTVGALAAVAQRPSHPPLHPAGTRPEV
jgi:DNA-binding transcriptional LysR family regulator